MPAEIEPFHAISINTLADELRREGRSIVQVAFGQPSTGAPAAAIAAAHAALDSDVGGYWESPKLRNRIAQHYREQYGVEIEGRQVILTCGASPALVLAMAAAFSPGDRIAMARPGYVSYRNNARALHLEPVEIPCGAEARFQVTAQAIADLDPAPQGLIIASPANPTGTIIEPDEMAAIAKVCRERGIRIVSDEIYHGLSYIGRARSILEFEPTALVVNSFSKYFSMVGWRLGWLVAPPDLMARARAYVGNFYLTAPSLSQHAGLAAMDCREELDGHLETYRRNREVLLAAMPRLGLSEIAPPDGAFYIYADVSHLTGDSLAFCERMLREAGVACAPGVDFDPIDGRHFIRLSFASATAEVEEAVRRLIPWFAAQGAMAPA